LHDTRQLRYMEVRLRGGEHNEKRKVRRCGRAVGCHVNAGREGRQLKRHGLGGYTLVMGEAWAEYRNGGGRTTDHTKRKLYMRKGEKRKKI